MLSPGAAAFLPVFAGLFHRARVLVVVLVRVHTLPAVSVLSTAVVAATRPGWIEVLHVNSLRTCRVLDVDDLDSPYRGQHLRPIVVVIVGQARVGPTAMLYVCGGELG